MSIRVQPLDAAFGVQVDLDPSVELDEPDRDAMRSLFLEHHFLYVPSEGMSVDEQVRICNYVANVLIDEGTPPEAYVSSPRGNSVLPDIELPWHSDMNFNVMPHIGASLYAEEIDEFSSPTWYASATRAAKMLPDELRERIAELTALHELPLIPKDAMGGHDVATEVDVAVPATRHPLLWEHPLTHEPLIYVSERQSKQASVLEDLDAAAAAEIIHEVFEYLYSPDNIVEHRWKLGDLIIWDNLAVQHRRNSVSGRRTLRRLALVEGSGAGDQYFKIQAMVKAKVAAGRAASTY
jgi:taurine dioxygenase